MSKLIAILNVVAWSGFWAFGYLALSATELSRGQVAIAAVLAAFGLFAGIACYVWLARVAEQRGYAKRSNQLSAAALERAHEQGLAG